MSDNDDEKVGYKQPPKRTQWKPGQSGNPRGPAKPKTQSFAALIDSALERRIWVTDSKKRGRKKVIEVIARRLVDASAKGDDEAIELFMALDAHGKKRRDNPGFVVKVIPDPK